MTPSDICSDILASSLVFFKGKVSNFLLRVSLFPLKTLLCNISPRLIRREIGFSGFTRTTPLLPLPGITLRDHDDSEEDIGEDTDDEEPHYSASPMDVGDDAPPSSPSSPISQLTREFQAFRIEM